MTTCCKQYCAKNGLKIPEKDQCIFSGDVVVLGRFDTTRWKVKYGWFSYDGNREICGWYLQKECDKSTIKPIQSIDLYDIYILESN